MSSDPAEGGSATVSKISEKKKSPLSLEQYIMKERAAKCSICALPEDVRETIRLARKKKIDRDTTAAWLREQHEWKGDDEDITRHGAANHDRRMKELLGDG